MAGQFDNNFDLNPKLKGTDRQLFDEFATILGHCGTAASENIKSNATSPYMPNFKAAQQNSKHHVSGMQGGDACS
jgi:hypothetical protein